MLLPSGFKHLTQWLRNIQFLCEVSEWMQLAVPVMIFLFRAKKGKKAKWAGSVHPCFLSISQSLLTDLYAGTHTQMHTLSLLLLVFICMYLSTLVRHIAALLLAASEVEELSCQLVDLCHWQLFAGKEGAWEGMPGKKETRQCLPSMSTI